MSNISRRKLITTGLVATAGVAGLAAAGPLPAVTASSRPTAMEFGAQAKRSPTRPSGYSLRTRWRANSPAA